MSTGDTTRTCGSCGATVSAADITCPSCGALLAAYEAPAGATSVAEAPTPPSPVEATPISTPRTMPTPTPVADVAPPAAVEPATEPIVPPESLPIQIEAPPQPAPRNLASTATKARPVPPRAKPLAPASKVAQPRATPTPYQQPVARETPATGIPIETTRARRAGDHRPDGRLRLQAGTDRRTGCSAPVHVRDHALGGKGLWPEDDHDAPAGQAAIRAEIGEGVSHGYP